MGGIDGALSRARASRSRKTRHHSGHSAAFRPIGQPPVFLGYYCGSRECGALAARIDPRIDRREIPSARTAMRSRDFPSIFQDPRSSAFLLSLSR